MNQSQCWNVGKSKTEKEGKKKKSSAIQGEFGLSKEEASLTFHKTITQIVDLNRFKEKILLTDIHSASSVGNDNDSLRYFSVNPQNIL